MRDDDKAFETMLKMELLKLDERRNQKVKKPNEKINLDLLERFEDELNRALLEASVDDGSKKSSK